MLIDSDLDWNQAPDDASHFGPHVCGSWEASWYKQDEEGQWHAWCDLMYGKKWITEFKTTDPYRIQQRIAALIERPPSWNGQGLPEIAAICEVAPPLPNAGVRVRVLCHDAGAAICRILGGDSLGSLCQLEADEMCPVPTAKQLAAQARENAIQEILDLMGTSEPAEDRAKAEKIYDGGYRKVLTQD